MQKYTAKDIDQLLSKTDKIKLIGKKAFKISKNALIVIKDKFKSELNLLKENVAESATELFNDGKEKIITSYDNIKEFSHNKIVENKIKLENESLENNEQSYNLKKEIELLKRLSLEDKIRKEEAKLEDKKALFSDVTEFLNDKTNEIAEQQEIFKNIVADINYSNNNTIDDHLVSELLTKKIKDLEKKKIKVSGRTYGVYALSKFRFKRMVEKIKKEYSSSITDVYQVSDSLLQENNDVLNVFNKDGKPYSIDDFLPQTTNSIDKESLLQFVEKTPDTNSSGEIENQEKSNPKMASYSIDDFMPKPAFNNIKKEDLMHISETYANQSENIKDNIVDTSPKQKNELNELSELINQKNSLDNVIEKLILESNLSGGDKKVIHNGKVIKMSSKQALLLINLKKHRVILNKHIKNIDKKNKKLEKDLNKIKVTNISKSNNRENLKKMAIVGALSFTLLSQKVNDVNLNVEVDQIDDTSISYEEQTLKPEINSVVPVVPVDKVEVQLDFYDYEIEINPLEPINKVDENEIEINENISSDVNIHDEVTFNEDTKIYANSFDGSNQTNQLNPIDSHDDVRVVSGVTFNLNGQIITIFENEENYVGKISDLIEQGAEKILYVTSSKENHNNNNNMYEGFVNIEDVVLQNEVTIGGNSR